ncbi:MAG TPA: FliM/FliN family flagellar motor switch protein [Candidatus Binataceae bacterium]|nr:FliM/FliN family flagellar motor switch protein [Candidatus Binataceae bacterium]
METPETSSSPTEVQIQAPPPVAKTSAAKTGSPNLASLGLDGADFSVLKQVPMTVQVEIGRTVMTLGEVLDELDVGASIRLDRHAGDPVEVYVNGALFARAEVVLMQDQIGARIIELVSPDKATRPAGLR